MGRPSKKLKKNELGRPITPGRAGPPQASSGSAHYSSWAKPCRALNVLCRTEHEPSRAEPSQVGPTQLPTLSYSDKHFSTIIDIQVDKGFSHSKCMENLKKLHRSLKQVSKLSTFYQIHHQLDQIDIKIHTPRHMLKKRLL